MSKPSITRGWLPVHLKLFGQKNIMIRNIVFLSIVTLFIFLQQACKPKFSHGKELYIKNCSNCHGANGTGLKSLYPPIASSDYLEENFDKLACIITKGIDKPLTVNGKTYNTPMIGLTELSDIEIANIVNYIAAEWHPKNTYISLKDINMIIGKCK